MKTQKQVISEPTSLWEITSNLKHLFDPSVWPILQSSSVVTKEETPKYVTTPMLRAKAVTGVLSIEPKSGHTNLYSDDIADDQTQKELDEFCKSSFGLYLSYFDEDGNFISSDSILTLFNLGHFFVLNGPQQKMNFYKNSCEDSSLFKMLDTEEEFKSIESLSKDVPDWKDSFQVINFSSMNFEDIFNYSKTSFYKKISQKVGVTLTAFLERLLFSFETKYPNLSEQMCSDIHIFSKNDYVRKFISHLVPDLLSNLKSTYVFNSEELKQKDLSKIALVSSSTDAFIKGKFWEKQGATDASLISYTAKKLLGEKDEVLYSFNDHTKAIVYNLLDNLCCFSGSEVGGEVIEVLGILVQKFSFKHYKNLESLAIDKNKNPNLYLFLTQSKKILEATGSRCSDNEVFKEALLRGDLV